MYVVPAAAFSTGFSLPMRDGNLVPGTLLAYPCAVLAYL